MPSVSKAQQKFMGMVHAAQKGDLENPSPEVEKAADSMTDKAAKDFASTKHKGLPGHVKKENKIDLEDEDLPSAVVPGVSVENTMKTYDASCGCFRTESINELTNNEKQIKNGNPNNVFYAFYKGQFEAVYWAMNPSDLIKIYWDKFKVRRPAGSKFKLNPEFIIVPKKEYDNSTSNRYAKLKPYVDKFWDKLQNESVNEAKVIDIIDRFEHLKLPDIVYLNKKPYTGKTFVMNGYNGYTSSDDDGWVYDSKTRKPLTDKQGNTLRATTHRGAKWDFKNGIRESVGVNQNAVMASLEDLPNNRTQKNFPLPTNRILWNATGKVCEGRPVVERIKMYEKKGGGWREGIADDEQVYNSLKELHSERKQVKEIKESVRAILKKKVQTESKLNEDISDVVMNGLQMIGIVGAGFFFRFLIRYMVGEFLKSSKDTTMNGLKSIIQGVKNAWSSLKNMSRIHQLEKELENDEDIKHAVSHPRTIDFAKVLKKKLDPKDYDLISKITRNNFR